MESKEDFTLLNLSKSSSSSDQSEELFKPESRIPKRKKRIKRRSTSQNHHSSNSSTQSNSIVHGTSQINVLYTVLIFLLCWVGTLTWLVFSLRNQLTDVTTRLDEATKLVKPFPDQLETLNQTLQKLNATLLDFNTKLNKTHIELNSIEKTVNANSQPLPTSELQEVQKEVATLGSSLGAKVTDLEQEISAIKAQRSQPPPQMPQSGKSTVAINKNEKATPSNQQEQPAALAPAAPVPNAR